MTRKRTTQEAAIRFEGHEEGKRPHAGRVLRSHGLQPLLCATALRGAPPEKGRGSKAPSRPLGHGPRGRKPAYTSEVKRASVEIWSVLDCPYRKRLAALPETLAAL